MAPSAAMRISQARRRHADAHGVAVHGGDGRLLQLVNAQGHQGSAPGVLHAVVAVGEAGLHLAPGQRFRLDAGRLGFLDVPVEVAHVGAGTEGRVGSGDQQHAALGIVLEPVQLGSHLGRHLRPQGVAGGRIVHGQQQDSAAVSVLMYS